MAQAEYPQRLGTHHEHTQGTIVLATVWEGLMASGGKGTASYLPCGDLLAECVHTGLVAGVHPHPRLP